MAKKAATPKAPAKPKKKSAAKPKKPSKPKMIKTTIGMVDPNDPVIQQRLRSRTIREVE